MAESRTTRDDPMGPGPWGCWHLRDRYWLGDHDGPYRTTERPLARLRATVLNEMLAPGGRELVVVPRTLDEGLVRTGDVAAALGPEQAIDSLESRGAEVES
jgi:hypothetical protein